VGLSDDQKAILRLLAQRGEAAYADLSALMGVSPEEIYTRAKDAAAALEAEGIPSPRIPKPSGGEGGGDSPAGDRLGGESPSGESPPPVPPKAEKPAPKEQEQVKPAPALPKGPPKPPLKKELKLLENRGLWAILAGVAILVIFLVIVLVGGGSDSGSGGDTSASGSTSGTASSCENVGKAPKPDGKAVAALAAATLKNGGKEATRAVLQPVDGSESGGLAVFGRVKKSLALQVVAEGLSPSSNCGYTIWLAASEKKMLPLASTKVGKDGKLGTQVEVPVEILAYLANETFGQIAVTRTDESQLKASLAKATKEKKAPVYTGTEVLRGTVTGPIVGAAQRIEERAGK
jgi:hypothetical protein